MYVKFEEDGRYGFYSVEVHGEEITQDLRYKKISTSLYDEIMFSQGMKVLTPSLDLIEIPIEEYVESPAELLDRLIKESQVKRLLEECSKEEAIKLIEYYQFWDPDYIDDEGKKMYTEGQRVRHSTEKGIELFEVIRSHKPQADWEPQLAISLFKNLRGKVVVDEEGLPTEEIPTWEEHVKYQFGEKVISPVDGKVYRSKFNGNNLWEPTTWLQGWEVVNDD